MQKDHLLADAFIRLLENTGEAINKEVIGQVVLKGEHLPQKKIKIIGCKISDIDLYEIHSKEGIEITDTTFDILRVTNCRTSTIEINNTKVKGSFDIRGKECELGLLSIGQASIIEHFRVFFAKLWTVEVFDTTLGTAIIAGQADGCDAKFIRIKIIKHIKFQVGIYRHLILEVIDGGTIVFNAKEIQYCSLAEVNNCIVKVSYESQGSSLVLRQCNLPELKIDSPQIQHITLAGNTTIDRLTMTGIFKSNFHIHAEEKHTAQNLKIGLLDLSVLSILNDFSVSINNVEIAQMRFNHSANYGKFGFHNASFKNEFSLINSQVGAFSLNNVKFSPSCSIQIHETQLLDATVTNVDWGAFFQLDELNNKPQYDNELDFQRSLQESYRQLKEVLQKSSNKIASLEFQRHELDKQLQVLAITKHQTKFSTTNKNLLWKTWGNYFILWTHKKASNFGQDVLRPFLLLFAFHLVWFNIFLLVNKVEYAPFYVNWNLDATCKGISDFFYTLLPTHGSTLTSFSTAKEVPIIGFWDLIMRVSSGYFIFYFITAARKYHS